MNTLNLNVLFGAAIDNAYGINCDGIPDLTAGEPLSSGATAGTGLSENTYRMELRNVMGQKFVEKSITITRYRQTEYLIRTVSMTPGIYFLTVFGKNTRKLLQTGLSFFRLTRERKVTFAMAFLFIISHTQQLPVY